MSNEGDSPKPCSVSIAPLRSIKLSLKSPNLARARSKGFIKETSGSTEFSQSIVVPRCNININRGDSLSEEEALELLVPRIQRFLQNNPHIHHSESSTITHCWKCETLWLRFRILIVDASTIQVQRRLGCSYKLRQVKRALQESLMGDNVASNTAPRMLVTRPALRAPPSHHELEPVDVEQDVEQMIALMCSSKIDSQLLALEAVANCACLQQQPRLLACIQELSQSSTDGSSYSPKVVRVAQCILSDIQQKRNGETLK